MTSINRQVHQLNEILNKIPMGDVTRKFTNNKIKGILLSLKEQDDDILDVVKKLECTRSRYHDV